MWLLLPQATPTGPCGPQSTDPHQARRHSGKSDSDGITDSGVIVGFSTDTSGFGHGWKWSTGTGTTEVFSPDGASLIFAGADGTGYAVGRYYPPGKLNAHAFRYHLANGYFEDLFPDCVRTVLEAVDLIRLVQPTGPDEDACLNDQDIIATDGHAIDFLGNVAGTLQVGVQQYKFAYLWPNGFAAVDLQGLAAPNSGIAAHQATAVYGALVIGPYTAANGATRTYSWTGGDSWVGDMGLSANIYPNALNSFWRIVGHSTTGTQHPVTWYNNQLLQLPVPSGLKNGDALAVNRCGSVVGSATDANGMQHALRWTKANCD
jgi:probable HAF family extracellular repeat protein